MVAKTFDLDLHFLNIVMNSMAKSITEFLSKSVSMYMSKSKSMGS